MSSLRNTILDAKDMVIEKVNIPEWNTDVFIRGITAPERDEYEAGFRKEVRKLRKGKQVTESKFVMDNARVRLAVLALCTSETDPTPIFTADDIPALKLKSAKAVDRIFDVASRLAGISESDIEELAGN